MNVVSGAESYPVPIPLLSHAHMLNIFQSSCRAGRMGTFGKRFRAEIYEVLFENGLSVRRPRLAPGGAVSGSHETGSQACP